MDRGLSQAKTYYSTIQYLDVVVPTVVPGYILLATAPLGEDIVVSPGLHHVASAEQSFLHMALEGNLPTGRFQATTACHRPNDLGRGPTYLEWFLKLELWAEAGEEHSLADDAARFYREQHGLDVEIVETSIGLDIVCGDVELGSYGSRNVMGVQWSYGTGYVPFRTDYVKRISQ